MKKSDRGFTIVELVVVIAVISTLTAIIFPFFTDVIENAKKTATNATISIANKELQCAEHEAELIAIVLRTQEETSDELVYLPNDNLIAFKKDIDGNDFVEAEESALEEFFSSTNLPAPVEPREDKEEPPMPEPQKVTVFDVTSIDDVADMNEHLDEIKELTVTVNDDVSIVNLDFSKAKSLEKLILNTTNKNLLVSENGGEFSTSQTGEEIASESGLFSECKELKEVSLPYGVFVNANTFPKLETVTFNSVLECSSTEIDSSIRWLNVELQPEIEIVFDCDVPKDCLKLADVSFNKVTVSNGYVCKDYAFRKATISCLKIGEFTCAEVSESKVILSNAKISTLIMENSHLTAHEKTRFFGNSQCNGDIGKIVFRNCQLPILPEFKSNPKIYFSEIEFNDGTALEKVFEKNKDCEIFTPDTIDSDAWGKAYKIETITMAAFEDLFCKV